MTIVVGYVPTPEGEAALTQAIAEARKSNTTLLVINSSKGDALVDNRYAQEPKIQSIEERLAAQGIDHVDQAAGPRPRCSRGSPGRRRGAQRRADRDRPAPPHSGGQTDHGQHLPADPAGGRLPGAGGQGRRGGLSRASCGSEACSRDPGFTAVPAGEEASDFARHDPAKTSHLTSHFLTGYS